MVAPALLDDTATDVGSSPGEPLAFVDAHAAATEVLPELRLDLIEHINRAHEVSLVGFWLEDE